MIARLHGRVEIVDGCWVWTGATTDGYGRVKVAGRAELVHRVVFAEVVGPIPAGMHLDHLCRERACCNPDHLEVVTQQENTLRGEGVTAANARKTHCVRDHEFTPDNTSVRGRDGARICKACRSIVNARRDRRASERRR